MQMHFDQIAQYTDEKQFCQLIAQWALAQAVKFTEQMLKQSKSIEERNDYGRALADPAELQELAGVMWNETLRSGKIDAALEKLVHKYVKQHQKSIADKYRGLSGQLRQIADQAGADVVTVFSDTYKNSRRIKLEVNSVKQQNKLLKALNDSPFGKRDDVSITKHSWKRYPYYGSDSLAVVVKFPR